MLPAFVVDADFDSGKTTPVGYRLAYRTKKANKQKIPVQLFNH